MTIAEESSFSPSSPLSNGTAEFADRETPTKRSKWLAPENSLQFRYDRVCCEIAGKFVRFYRFALRKLLIIEYMAERVGFEPTVPVKVHTLSKRAP
jgi:hypothetical protein